MFGRSLEPAVMQFAGQFELDGETCHYRRSRKGAPIPVTTGERDDFIAAYRRQVRWLTWGTAGLMMVAIILLVLLTADDGQGADQWRIFGLVVVVMIPLLIVHHRIWNAPARHLERRAAVGTERSRGEVSRIMLGEMGWGQLIATLVLVPAGLITVAGDWDIWNGWGQLWLVFVGALMLVVLYQMVRKWQIGAGGD